MLTNFQKLAIISVFSVCAYAYRAVESYETMCVLRLTAEQICDVDQVKDNGTGTGVGLFNELR